TADDIERSVTRKIEQEMQGLDKLKQISSVTGDGFSIVRVEFDDGITSSQFERLFQDVGTRFSGVKLPDGTLKGSISDFSSNDFLPVIEISLTGSVPYETLERTASLLRDKILELSDVSSVTAVGAREHKIVVEADRDKLETLGVSLNDVVRAVQQKNVSIPGGTIETATREFLLRTVGNLQGVDDFDKVIVRRTGANGSILQVGDLGLVREVYESGSSDVRFNGEDGLVLRVTKVPQGDAISIVDGITALVSDSKLVIPEGVNLTLLNDSTIQIRDSINVLITNAAQGLFLLVVILFFFVGIRNALMTAFGIPVTFAITFIILEALGETLNSNTLFGLVLVLGMIVDHAIVITENALRLRQLGQDSKSAAINGTNEVLWPIIAASLTTMAAFLPLMLLPGTIGKFLRVIPLVVTVSLAVSTIEALFFIPSHLVHWPGGNKAIRQDFFDKIKPKFEKISTFLYEKRGWTIAVFAVIVISIFSTLAFIRVDLFSAEDYTLFYIDIEMPNGANKVETTRIVKEFENRLLPLRGNGEIVHIVSTIGKGAGNKAEIIVDLAEKNEGRKRSITAIMDETQTMMRDIPGVENVLFRKAQSGPPTSAPIGFRLRGDDYNALSLASEGIQAQLAKYPELFNIEDTLEAGTPELRIRINEERAAAYGLSVSSIGLFIRGMLDGIPAGSLFVNNNEIDVVVRYANSDSSASIESLMGLKIPSPTGKLVPFSSVCSLELDEGLASIKRVDGKREVSISAEARDKKNVPSINTAIKNWFNTEFSPQNPGVDLVLGGEFSDFANLLVQILRVFLLGLFLIYAVLGAQFKSYTQPFIILLSIPMAFAGVIFYLTLSGTPFSTTVLYAGVALAGISVNDTIVLIDFINTRRKEGLAVKEAVIEAAATRLRPIILTSVTTIAGLLPTALGFGGYSVVW
ncbi:MAG TPA: efflux RND transporter permease subunit, partial [Treponemataceae bacterium]|nr:efflux RND transporter permease subunit [Treponemataceae bacterium]